MFGCCGCLSSPDRMTAGWRDIAPDISIPTSPRDSPAARCRAPLKPEQRHFRRQSRPGPDTDRETQRCWGGHKWDCLETDLPWRGGVQLVGWLFGLARSGPVTAWPTSDGGTVTRDRWESCDMMWAPVFPVRGRRCAGEHLTPGHTSPVARLYFPKIEIFFVGISSSLVCMYVPMY